MTTCTYCGMVIRFADSPAKDEEGNPAHATCRIRFLEADREAWKTLAELNRLKYEDAMETKLDRVFPETAQDCCTRCANRGNEPHECPYRVEIEFDNSKCRCCVDCTERCADEI